MNLNISDINNTIYNAIEKSYPGYVNEVIQYNKIVIPRQQAWSIYKIRYNIKLGENAHFDQGAFKKAIDRLYEFEEESVCVHTLISNKKRLVIAFTDITDTKMIGVFEMLSSSNENG
jgi:hypothetical protein